MVLLKEREVLRLRDVETVYHMRIGVVAESLGVRGLGRLQTQKSW